jgi:hypothetical protein
MVLGAEGDVQLLRLLTEFLLPMVVLLARCSALRKAAKVRFVPFVVLGYHWPLPLYQVIRARGFHVQR